MPFESLGAVSYSPSIVTMAVSVAVCELSSGKEWCDLENRVRVLSRWNGTIWEIAYKFIFAFHSNYGDVLYHLWDIPTYWYKIAKFLYPTCLAPLHGWPRRNFVKCLMLVKLEWFGYVWWKNYDNMLSRFHLIPERHGQTDRRTDRIAISISRVSVLTRYKKRRAAALF